ncbi:MAG: hypothetical protein LBL79_07765 [Prevotella sp.]|jgi:hypothetical protein|nr:hypothetical protein [Prevotella sp.]
MIVDKKNKNKNEPALNVGAEEAVENTIYTTNALIDVFNAVKEILGTLREEEEDPGSPALFKTIALNTGQLSRIKNNKHNQESALLFPAVFLHFINVRYLVQQARIGEGRATLRVQYVLNRLNNSDEEFELEGYALFQRINIALQDGKNKYPALTERFNLTYFDQPESFDDGLQPFWIDYEIWFREDSAYKYRNYVDRYLIVPPFTNHSDQLPESNVDNHEDHTGPEYDEVSDFSK